MKLLEVKNLEISKRATAQNQREIPLVFNASLSLEEGEIIALVGESGSGKSIFALSLLGLLPSNELQQKGGEIRYYPQAVTKKRAGQQQFENVNNQDARNYHLLSSEADFARVRSQNMSMIFQEPASYLNPLMKIKKQLHEVYQIRGLPVDEKRIADLFKQMGLTDQRRIYESYPHQLSGGMLQRVFFVMALLLRPRLIIADEPTTALDLINQKRILVILRDLCRRERVSVLLISHNIHLVSQIATRIILMVCGNFVEQGNTKKVLENPCHPYTQALLAAAPKFQKGRRSAADRRLIPIAGESESLAEYEKFYGQCAFYGRCRLRIARCKEGSPPWQNSSSGQVRCILA